MAQLILTASVCTSLITACQTAKPLSQESQPGAMSVLTAPAEEKLVTESSTLLATLKSRKAVTLQSQVPGQIEEIYVSAGQEVTKGANLIKLDQAKQTATVSSLMANSESLRSERDNARESLKSLQANIRSKVATVEFCKAQLSRYTQLLAQGAVSHEAVEQHSTNLKVAESELEALESHIKAQQAVVEKNERLIKQSGATVNEQKEQLRYYTVKAPLDGVVGDIPVKLGEYVTPSTVLTTVNQNKPLEAYINVPTDQASKLHVGLSVKLADNELKICGSGVISFISPQVNNDNQSVLVKALIPNVSGALRSGQLVSAQIVWQQNMSVVVPTSSVSQLSGQSFVFVAESNGKSGFIAKQKPVELGDIEGGDYRVLKGLKAGEKVIRSGIQNLADGMPVTPKS